MPSLSPMPSCIPLITAIGTKRSTFPIRLLTPSKKTTAPTISPAAAISPGSKCSAIATAAIAFIGCTGIGKPNIIPVVMLNSPAKINTRAGSRPLTMTSAAVSGMKVPKSPRPPENSSNVKRIRRMLARQLRPNVGASSSTGVSRSEFDSTG